MQEQPGGAGGAQVKASTAGHGGPGTWCLNERQSPLERCWGGGRQGGGLPTLLQSCCEGQLSCTWE